MSRAQAPPSAERQAQLRMEQQEHSAAQQTAHSKARRETVDLSALDDPGLIEELAAPDIGRGEDDDLEEMLAAEFPKHLAFGDISREEWEYQQRWDKADARLVKCEFPKRGRIGSKCRGVVHQIMTGGDEPERPPLNDDMAREIGAAFEERTMARSLSVDARGFRGLTEAIVETRSNRNDTAESKSGLLGRLFG